MALLTLRFLPSDGCAPGCSQTVEPRAADAAAVRLGALSGRLQARLDGFKSRALRAAASASHHLYAAVSASHHLYATEWRALDGAHAASEAMLTLGDGELAGCGVVVVPPMAAVEVAALGGGEGHVVMCAMAMRRALQPLGTLGAALALAQVQAAPCGPLSLQTAP